MATEMRLIYHCGRLRAQGYATFLGTSGPAGAEGASPHLLWQAIERGAAVPGSTGIVRRLAAEGREIVETLVLDHSRVLTAGQRSAVENMLSQIFDRDLARALKAANGSDVSLAAAQAMIEAALASALPALARLVPPSARKVVAVSQPIAARPAWRRKAALFGGSAVLIAVVLAGIWLAFHAPGDVSTAQATSETGTAEPKIASQEIRDAVTDFLRACHGEPEPALVDELATAYADRTLTIHVDGRRDYLQLIDPSDRQIFSDLDGTTDKDICDRRQALWQAMEALRPHIGEATPLPYADALAALSVQHDAMTIPTIAQTVARAEPPPSAPADCARERCFPILDPDDVAALDWIKSLYLMLEKELPVAEAPSAAPSSLDASLPDLARRLRAAEVRFRGELVLAGEATEHPDWLKHLWNCEGRDHLETCELPLAQASNWAGR